MKAGFDRRTSLTFGDLTREHRRSRPDRPAVVDGDIRMTYHELDARSNRLASAMLGHGVRRGDRIAWLGQNSYRVLGLLIAAATLGGSFCPVNWRSSAAEVGFVLDDRDPTLVVWQGQELGDTARAARESAGAAGVATGALWLQHDADAGEDSYEV